MVGCEGCGDFVLSLCGVYEGLMAVVLQTNLTTGKTFGKEVKTCVP